MAQAFGRRKNVLRLEPIIFVIIAARLPARQNEKTLNDEISRQTQKANTMHRANGQAWKTREALEEKLKNVSARSGRYETKKENQSNARAKFHTW